MLAFTGFASLPSPFSGLLVELYVSLCSHTMNGVYYSVVSVQTKRGASWGCTYRKPLLCLGAHKLSIREAQRDNETLLT